MTRVIGLAQLIEQMSAYSNTVRDQIRRDDWLQAASVQPYTQRMVTINLVLHYLNLFT